VSVGRYRLEADGAELFPESGEVRLYGNALAFDQGHRLEADEIRYQEPTGRIEAKGNLLLQQPGLLASAASGVVERDTERGRFEGVEFRLPALRARGRAEVAEFEGRDRSRYQGVGYSTCPPGRDDWLLEAGQLEIDRADGSGTARDAKLSFFGVPLFYTPYLSFPVGEQRKSGLLPPTFGHSSETGLDLSLPYYFNLAPNYDATLTPRVTSERGLLLGGEFRYLTPTQQGETHGELLPHDQAAEGDERTLRGAFAHRGNGRLGPGWRFDVNYNWVSDNDYLEELGGGEVASRQRHLERRGDLLYAGSGWSFLGRVQGYQTIDEQHRPRRRALRPAAATAAGPEPARRGVRPHLPPAGGVRPLRPRCRGHRRAARPAARGQPAVAGELGLPHPQAGRPLHRLPAGGPARRLGGRPRPQPPHRQSGCRAVLRSRCRLVRQHRPPDPGAAAVLSLHPLRAAGSAAAVR
jgi:lipopolysaccharide assembly outer membrane protein LptD (OstA)